MYRLIWLVLITQNLLAQLMTGPWKAWNEAVFKFYYVLLFILSGVIVHHIQSLKPTPSNHPQLCGSQTSQTSCSAEDLP